MLAPYRKTLAQIKDDDLRTIIECLRELVIIPCPSCSPVDSGTGTRASVPSSPHETGNFTCEECWGQDGEHEADCPDGGTTAMPPSAAPTNPVPSRSDSEGELRARIEAKAALLEIKALEQTDQFGNYVTGEDGVPGSYKEGRADAFDFAAQMVRSLLVPKEEDGYDYHWCPGVGWCPGCPPSAVPKEEPSAAAEPAAARSVSEGEGLAARIEELIEVVKGIDETVGSFGYSLGLLNVEGSAGDLEDLEMVLDEAEKLADRARSLLVPKEEA